MAKRAQFYKAILDALEYRGTAFLQTFTTASRSTASATT